MVTHYNNLYGVRYAQFSRKLCRFLALQDCAGTFKRKQAGVLFKSSAESLTFFYCRVWTGHEHAENVPYRFGRELLTHWKAESQKGR